MSGGIFDGLPDPGPGVNFGQPAQPAGVNFDKPQAPQLGSPEPLEPPQGGPTFELASWGRRATAAILDGVVVGLLVFVVFAVLLATLPDDLRFDESGSDTRSARDFVAFLWALFLTFVWITLVVLVYAPTYMWRTNGRTLGKQLLGIRVVRADGARMTFWFAVFREFLVKGLLGAVASSFTLYLYALLDVLWPLWDSEHRAIHDHIARTRVVRD